MGVGSSPKPLRKESGTHCSAPGTLPGQNPETGSGRRHLGSLTEAQSRSSRRSSRSGKGGVPVSLLVTFAQRHPEQSRQGALRLTWVTVTAHEPQVTSGGSIRDLPQASRVPKAPPGRFLGNEPTRRCPSGAPPRGQLVLQPLCLNTRGSGRRTAAPSRSSCWGAMNPLP